MTPIKLRISDLKTIFVQINSLTGIDFSNYAFFSIKRRFEKVINLYNFESVTELLNKITNDKQFLKNFIFDIIPHQTELFRDAQTWNVILKQVLPKLSKKEKLNIYLPYCISGDELYSLIFILSEANMLDNTEITVSSLSDINIEFIKDAIYPLKKLSSAEKNIEELYTEKTLDDFVQSSQYSYEIKPEYRKNIKFDNKTIFNQDYIKEFDLILCRNSMLYFNAKLQEEVLINITEALKKNAYLIIGIGEELTGFQQKKYKIINNEESIYKKNI